MAADGRRSSKVFKAMNRPLTILGAERRLFFVALISGGAIFSLLHSLLGGIGLFVVGVIVARIATRHDVEILRVLERKGHIRHVEEGLRYVYLPAVERETAKQSAIQRLISTFFDGSAEKVVGALLGGEGARLSEEELERIAQLLAKARKDGPR